MTRNTDILAKRRGRPPGLLTDRRKQILGAIIAGAAEGKGINFTRLANQCGLCDYREARRIVKDLQKMSLV
jgi:predicted transcriptional regulator